MNSMQNHSEDYYYSNEGLFRDEISVAEDESLRHHIRLFFITTYLLLFIVGSVGNGYVIIMICNVIIAISKNRRSSKRRMSASSTTHVFIYVLGLSVVDFLVILHLPMLIIDMWKRQWIFGQFQLMCKLYWYGESVNKLLSSFLMTVLSWDRYLAVCSPLTSFRMRQNAVAITVVLSFYFLATILLYPVLKESIVLKVNKLTGERFVGDSIELQESDRLGLTIQKCIFDSGTPMFMVYTFVAGYLLPALFITYFYLRVILRLRDNVENVRKHSDSHSSQIFNAMFHKVFHRIVLVILFYFLCWTPYWMLNIMSQFGAVMSWSMLSLSTAFFSAHLLVCFNSATNPVLYALLNRELRQQHVEATQKRRQSFYNVKQNALDLISPHRSSYVSICGIFTAANNIKQDQLAAQGNGTHLFPSARHSHERASVSLPKFNLLDYCRRRWSSFGNALPASSPIKNARTSAFLEPSRAAVRPSTYLSSFTSQQFTKSPELTQESLAISEDQSEQIIKIPSDSKSVEDQIFNSKEVIDTIWKRENCLLQNRKESTICIYDSRL